MAKKTPTEAVRDFMGRTVEEAQEQNICLQCKQDISKEMDGETPVSETPYYRSTGLCPTCFAAMVEETK